MMTIALYVVGYLATGAAVVGIISGLEESMFSGSDGDNMAICFACLWPLLIVAFFMWGIHYATKKGVHLVKKFIKL